MLTHANSAWCPDKLMTPAAGHEDAQGGCCQLMLQMLQLISFMMGFITTSSRLGQVTTTTPPLQKTDENPHILIYSDHTWTGLW